MIRSITPTTVPEMEKYVMNEKGIALKERSKFGVIVALSALALVVIGTRPSFAQQTGQKTFDSATEASHALFLAVRNQDDQAVGAILGAGKEVTSSNDEVEDKLERDRFTQKYQEMHRLVQEPDGTTVLYVGAENWPFPVPLAAKHGRWYFDTDAGIRELLFRQVGENEITAIQVCRSFAAAKMHEAKSTANDPISQYTQSLIAIESANPGNTLEEGSSFHGYYFRIGTAEQETPTARGNTQTSSAKKISGVVLVAIPADYGASGVMTFIVTQDGAVYQKDLGADTAKVGPELLKQRSAKSRWQAVNEEVPLP
jgi:Protein of unknown function (DUF2950)